MRGRHLESRVVGALTALVGSLLGSLHGSPAFAYDYNEHAYVSHRALLRLAQGLATGGAPDLAKSLHAVLDSGPSGTTCDVARIIEDEAPSDCFAAADVPALAGDHSPSPVMTKWRWFDDTVPVSAHAPFVVDVAKMLVAVTREDAAPEQAAVGKPSPFELIQYRADFSSANWRDGFARMGNFALLEIDRSYVQLAARGHSHFRQRQSSATVTRLAARRRYQHAGRERHKPAQEAYSWYGDLHLGALWFAHLAHERMGAGQAEAAELFAGLAWFLELHAWHYLQDGVASGHFLGDLDVLEATTLNATHDRYGSEGVRVRPPRTLQIVARQEQAKRQDPSRPQEPPTLGSKSRWIDAGLSQIGRSDTVLLHGDGQLASAPLAHAASLAWATTLSWISGEEVSSVLRGGGWKGAGGNRDPKMAAALGSPDGGDGGRGERLRALERCPQRANPDELFMGLFEEASSVVDAQGNLVPGAPPNAPIYSCLHAWWESPSSFADRNGDIVEAAYADYFEAAFLLPEPRDASEDLPQYTYFTGGALGLGVGFATAEQRALVPALDVSWIGGAPRYTVHGLAQVAAYVRFVPPEDGEGTYTEWRHSSDQAAWGMGVQWRPFWGPHHFMSAFSVGFLHWPERWDAVPDLRFVPIAWLPEDEEEITLGLGPQIAFNPRFGWSVGGVLDVGWWPNE